MSKKKPPISAPRPAVAEGRIEGHPDGHGFLVPEGDGPWIALPAAEMRQVLRGDRERVRILGTDPRGRPSGEIVEVLERANRRIVGRLHKEHGVLFLVPEDRRMPVDILIPPDQTGRGKGRALQRGQINSNFCPHFSQNLTPSRFSNRHLGHFMVPL